MDYAILVNKLKNQGLAPLKVMENCSNEVYLEVSPEHWLATATFLHEQLRSPVMALFALDERARQQHFLVTAAFVGLAYRKWFFLTLKIPAAQPSFPSMATKIYSANLFEREIREMFGLEPQGNPDHRRLNLHEEVWPEGFYPLRKDFDKHLVSGEKGSYRFAKVEGEGIFEVPVGPVHAGIIGPGHFRFGVAGEPIINLDIRLGFTHRGVEKTFEGKRPEEGLLLSECVAGDSAFAHSWSFCRAMEKISGLSIPERALSLRAIFLELERMSNHLADLAGIALDVGFSFPAAYASLVKEALHTLNQQLTGSRYLKGTDTIGGVLKDLTEEKQTLLLSSLKVILADFNEIKNILSTSTSFMDRVETTGILRRKTAEDFGVVGLVGRASGLALDFRQNTPPYKAAGFKMVTGKEGDVLARLNVRLGEFEESVRLIKELINHLPVGEIIASSPEIKAGQALGCIEGWRGPVLYWVKTNETGIIDRCKIVDPSFHNWPGLSYAVLDNIIPDFPVCNKSFNLSYAGNDL